MVSSFLHSEMAWNDTSIPPITAGISLGKWWRTSIYFAKPAWQVGTGVPNDSKRDVPDIAVNASPFHDAYLFCSEDVQVAQGVDLHRGFRDSNQNLAVLAAHLRASHLCSSHRTCRPSL